MNAGSSWTSQAMGGIFDCRMNEDFTLINADEALYTLLGYTEAEYEKELHNAMIRSIYEEDRLVLLKELKADDKQHVHMFENRLLCRNGSIKWVWISVQRTYNEAYGSYYHCIFHDISEDVERKKVLEISKKRLAFLLEQTQDIVFEYDLQRHEIFYTDNFAKKFGYTIPKDGFPDAMFQEDIVYQEDVDGLRSSFQAIMKGEEHMTCEYRLRYRDLGYRWVKAYATGLRDQEGNLFEILGVIIDIHEQKQELLKTRREAALDPLTGLYNRRECIRLLDNYIAIEEDMMAFILIDLDDFKMINDTMGHTTGDRALKCISDVLRSLTRSEDIVARIGGDEFVVCLLHLPNQDVAVHKIERIQHMFHTHLKEQLGLTMSCSIGICFYPQQGNDFSSLMESADQAMYYAKKEGKNRYHIHEIGQQQLYLNPTPYMKKNFRDYAIERMLNLLQSSTTTEEAIEGMLKLVHTMLHSDRSLIYLKQKDRYVLIYKWISDSSYDLLDDQFPMVEAIKHSPLFHHGVLALMDFHELEEGPLQEWYQRRHVLAAMVYLRTLTQDDDVILCFEDCHNIRKISVEARYSLQLVVKVIMMLMKHAQSKRNTA